MKHKKYYLLVVFIFIQICSTFFSVTYTTVKAETADEQLNESIHEMLNVLDLKELQAYVDGLSDISEESVKDRLLAYIKGSPMDYERFWSEISHVLFKNIGDIIPAFACIAAIALLSGVLSTLHSGSTMRTSTETTFLISYAAALIPLIAVLIECFEKSLRSVGEMQTQMQIIYPLLLTLMAASGGTLSASVCRPAVAFFSTTIVSVIRSVVFPLTVAIIAFSMAANLSKELKMNKFTTFFKSINKWIIGICVSVFGLFFTLQGITVATYDGVARRAAKYAIGNGIPIVGGFLSGGFDLAVAGSILIKNSLGSMSIFLLISVVFEPVILLISCNLLLRFTAAISQPFGDSRISDFLGETAENLHYCTAGLLFIAFLYFLSIMLMVSTSEIFL
ncbi:MAG: stage III sporulation protein AE [Clostridia bacterium]|nr:stage III sporulation protein AE [Clostridia bacterium]